MESGKDLNFHYRTLQMAQYYDPAYQNYSLRFKIGDISDTKMERRTYYIRMTGMVQL